MHIITANEMKINISKMNEQKNELFETIDSWAKVIREELTQGETLNRFMQRAIDYTTTCVTYITEKNVEIDEAHYTSLIDFLNTTGKKQKEEMKKYLAIMKQLEEMFEEEKQNVPEENLGKLIHATEMYHVSKLIMQFYGFILAYDEAQLILYRYMEKVENKRTAYKHIQ